MTGYSGYPTPFGTLTYTWDKKTNRKTMTFSGGCKTVSTRISKAPFAIPNFGSSADTYYGIGYASEDSYSIRAGSVKWITSATYSWT